MAVTQTIVLEIVELNQTGYVSMDPGGYGATGSSAGFISGADKTKLDSIETGAQVNKINSIYNMDSELHPDADGRVDIAVPFLSFYGED